jgi:rRNA maturation RNase YbeY
MLKPEVKKIRFHFLSGSFFLPFRTPLKGFILKLFKKEGFKVEAVNYIFCSDKHLLGINRKYLSHDTYTDIITFQYSSSSEPVLSDIYISVERVKENARFYKTPFLQELYRVMFHGALHLCNYKDKTPKEVSLMRRKEDFYLKKYVPREITGR